MQITLLIGLIGGVALLIFGILVGGGNVIWFADAPSAIVTIGGSFASMLVSFKLENIAKMPKLMKIAIFPPNFDPKDLIITIVSFSEKARREGLLALEDDLEDLNDQFMKKGIQLVVDGTDPELVRSILENEIGEMESRHDGFKRLFVEAATLAPAFGMIGTLMGLVMMLVNLSDKSTVGPYLAVAIITTFYGAVLAYLVFTPFATRLELLNSDEAIFRTIILEGTLSIQSGDNPRIVKDKLIAFLPPAAREEISKEVGD